MKQLLNNNILENTILMNKINFYWEDLNQYYPINKNKKYVIYFKGCFGPPTNGHMNAIKNVIEHFGKNVFIIINQLGFSKRHGVSKKTNIYIMKTYLAKLFPKANISLLFRARFWEIQQHPFLEKADSFIIIKGSEHIINNTDDIIALEKDYLKKIKNYIRLSLELNLNLDLILQTRPYNEISASNFIQSLLNYRNKVEQKASTDKEIDNILKFIPHELSIKKTLKIVNKLIKYPLYSGHSIKNE